MTPTEFRAMIAALPGTDEAAHHDHPDFRVGGRIFATLSGPGEGFAAVRLVYEDAEGLVSERPDFRLLGARGGFGWVRMELACVRPDQLRPLLEAAWRLRAPNRPSQKPSSS